MSSPDRARSKNLGSLKFAFAFLKPYIFRVLLAVVALLFTSAVSLSLGQGLRVLVDRGFGAGSLEQLTQTVLIFAVLSVLLALGTLIRHYFISWLGERVVADMRQQVFERVIGLHPAYFETNLSGEIQTRITADTTIIQSVIGSSISVALRNILMFLGGLVLLFYTDVKLTLIVMVSVPLILGPVLLMGRRVRNLSRTTQDRMARLGAYVGESLQNIKTVQAFNHQAEDRRIFSEVVEDTFAAARSRIWYRSFLIAIVMGSMLLAIALMLWIGGADVLNNRISAGSLVSFCFYAFIVALSVASLSEVYGDLQRAAGATERLAELNYCTSLILPPARPQKLSIPVQGKLTLENITFSYPARTTIAALDNYSLEIKAGENLALVGPSGAGKTTLFDMLLRFYDPQVGLISLDGIDIRELNPDDLRAQIAIVPQEPALFTSNLRENIRYGRPNASDTEIEAAAGAAYADEFIAQLPEGYDTFLGEKGVRLSGGQKQRIAIARAILKDPAVLLLDEATSALDAHSEEVVQKALNSLMQNRTTLIIAHRLATVMHVDRIAVMEAGHLIATGTHSELLESSSLYARLSELQFGYQARV